MLDIFPKCNLVQYQGKLVMQPWENGKNPNFGDNLHPPPPSPPSKRDFFSWVFSLLVIRQCSSLSSYVISRKTNESNSKKSQKPKFQARLWPKFGPPKFFRKFYLYWMLHLVASYNCMQFQGKLMNQTWEKGKKTSFGSDFDSFGPNLYPKFFFVDFTSARS